MTEIFKKIGTGFTVSWDIEKIAEKFEGMFVDPLNVLNRTHNPYSSASENPHWQLYPTGILFARNFYFNFRDECIEVADKLRELQDKVKSSSIDYTSDLVREFLNHTPSPQKVNIMKISPGVSVKVHCDTTRSICINIGLKNSSTCKTHISDTTDDSKFWTANKIDYIMEDGDVYLIDIKNAHRVESLVPEDRNLTRYIITYNMVNR